MEEKADLNFEQIEAILEKENIPGLQYVVVDETGIIYEYSGGLLDMSGEALVNDETIFMLNSSTKVFTAAAILRLRDKGKLELDKKLSEYFESHPYGQEIRILQLLNHTSGIPNPLPLKWLHLASDAAAFDESAALEAVLQRYDSLNSKPGEKYAYSNISYWLLGKVIEELSGMSYCEYLESEIFPVIGVKEGELACYPPDHENVATGHLSRWSAMDFFLRIMGGGRFYEESANGYIRFKRLVHNGPAYGGLYGNAKSAALLLVDMLKDRSRLFSEDTKKLFFRHTYNNSGELLPSTVGWYIGILQGDSSNQVLYYSKPGGGPGFASNLRIYPEQGIGTVFLMNKMEVSERPIQKLSDQLDWNYLTNR